MYESRPMRPKDFAIALVQPRTCPIRASLGVLGRKWALLVMRDVAFHHDVRFSDILRNNPGLTPRVLAFRLKELQREGFLAKVPGAGREVTYELTPKGWDAVPVLTAFLSFGIKHHAAEVFADGKARPMCDMLPRSQEPMLGDLLDYAKGRRPPRGARRPRA